MRPRVYPQQAVQRRRRALARLAVTRCCSRALGVLLLLCCAWGCSAYSRTPRTAGGVEIDDRPIPAAAYAAFLEGAQLEATGQLGPALRAFRTARSHDAESAEIQTRIAVITCQLEPERATAEFEEATELDRQYEGAWREWALCELQRGKLTRALSRAKQAVRHAPYSLQSTLVVARVYEGRGEPTQALRQLIAFVLRFPNDLQAWYALYVNAQRYKDALWAQRAATVLITRALHNDPLAKWPPGSAAQQLTWLALSGDWGQTRKAAVELGVPAAELAWLALENDQAHSAAQQAELLWGALPQDVEMAIVGMLAAHRLGDASAYQVWLTRAQSCATQPLSARASAALAQLLELRSGAVARTAFESQPTHAVAPTD